MLHRDVGLTVLKTQQIETRLDHIIKIAAAAGFAGVEPETRFLGELADAQKMKFHLDKNGIELASLCLVEDWQSHEENEEERKNAEWVIDYLAENFPKTVLNLCPMPGANRSNLRGRQEAQLACMNAIAKRAADRGLVSAYHPNSPAGSVCRVKEDYEFMLKGLDAEVLGWIPDVGHLAKGGIDPLTMMQKYSSIIKHVHYKDMSKEGAWEAMGKGIIDFKSITSFMASLDFDGWLVVEDECKQAELDPDGITKADGVYIQEVLEPLLNVSNTDKYCASMS